MVGGHEAAQGVGVDPAIAMRDRLERDVVYARLTRRRTEPQARKLPDIATRQMPLGGTNLLFDEMEVVEQPLAGRRDPMVHRYRGGQPLADAGQDAFVRSQAREKLVPCPARRQPMRQREGLAVPLHLVGAEQFGA